MQVGDLKRIDIRRIRPDLTLALLVLGMRLLVVSYSGSPLPLYDQWVAEFHNTFVRILTGAGVFDVLLIQHNEHILLTTRLVSLFGFLINGYWDIPFLVFVAACVRAFVAVLTYRMVAPAGSEHRRAAWMACAVLFAIPYSGYNVLSGLQLSFYFGDLALLWSVSIVLRWRSAIASGAGLAMAMLFGLCSMGSAIVLPAATLAVHLTHKIPRRGFWVSWACCVLCAVVYAALVRDAGGRDLFANANLSQGMFFLRMVSWPLDTAWIGIVVLGLGAWCAFIAVQKRQSFAKSLAPLVGIGAFALGNVAILALSRQPESFHMRHWEAVAWLPFSLFLALKVVRPDARLARFRIANLVGLFQVACLVGVLGGQTIPYLMETHRYREDALLFFRDAFLSGRIIEERERLNQMLLRRDFSFFDDPIQRYMPHPSTVDTIASAPSHTLSLLAPEILPIHRPSLASRVIHWTCEKGSILCFSAMALLHVPRRKMRTGAATVDDNEEAATLNL